MEDNVDDVQIDKSLSRSKWGRLSWAAAIFGVWCFVTGVIASLPIVRRAILPAGQAVNGLVNPEGLPSVPTDASPTDFYAQVYPRSRIEAVAPWSAGDVETASQFAGFSLIIPSYLPLGFTPSERIGFNTIHAYRVAVDFSAARALLEEIGIPAEQLPRGVAVGESLVTVQPVAAFHASAGDSWISLLQGRAPLATVPPEHDRLELDRLGRFGLQYLGLPEDAADQLSRRLSWTWFLAFPPGDLDRAEAVLIRGVEGFSLIQGANPNAETALIWESGGIIYAIYGNLPMEEMQRIASGLQ